MPRAVLMMLMGTAFLIEATAGAQNARPSGRAAARADHPPVSTAEARQCATCHAEVASHRVMHGPSASGACQTCHVVTVSNGRSTTIALAGGARRGDTKRLCVACHEEAAAGTGNPHVHAPVAAGDCTSCHDPHGSGFRYFLPAEGNGVCFTCHADVAEAVGKAFGHEPAAASCTLCHDPHAAKFPSQLRAGVNTVCLACHLEMGPDDALPDHVVLFGKTGAQQKELIANGSRIRLDATRRAGHPSVRHPIEGPSDPAAKARALSCASCHNPHGAKSRTLLRFGATGVSSLCVRCHQF
jgi:predicted CXXCH cytochrome family protein